jgi:hypothetical protein
LTRFEHWGVDPQETTIPVPYGQPHNPPLQAIPPEHLTPQAPQWDGSDVLSTHEPPQLTSGDGHAAA